MSGYYPFCAKCGWTERHGIHQPAIGDATGKPWGHAFEERMMTIAQAKHLRAEFAKHKRGRR